VRAGARRDWSTHSAGIEKQDVTGNISYDPDNHASTWSPPAPEGRRWARRFPPNLDQRPPRRSCLVVGWGGTYGVDHAAVERRRPRASRSAPRSTCVTSTRCARSRPPSCAEYRKVLVPEINSGQPRAVLRRKYLVGRGGLSTALRGLPLASEDISWTPQPTDRESAMSTSERP